MWRTSSFYLDRAMCTYILIKNEQVFNIYTHKTHTHIYIISVSLSKSYNIYRRIQMDVYIIVDMAIYKDKLES